MAEGYSALRNGLPLAEVTVETEGREKVKLRELSA